MSVVRADGGEAAIAVKRDFVGVRLVEKRHAADKNLKWAPIATC
jgi:hypothetical protein